MARFYGHELSILVKMYAASRKFWILTPFVVWNFNDLFLDFDVPLQATICTGKKNLVGGLWWGGLTFDEHFLTYKGSLSIPPNGKPCKQKFLAERQSQGTSTNNFCHKSLPSFLKLVSTIFIKFLFFSPKDSYSKTMKSFLFDLESSFHSQDIQILVIFSLSYHTF